AAAVGAVLDLELTAVRGGDGIDDRKTQAGSVGAAVAAPDETPGGVADELGREPGPVVTHGHDRPFAVARHLHVHLRVGMARRVLDHIDHGAFDGVLVAADLRRAGDRHWHG